MKPFVTLGVRNLTLLEGYALLDSYRNKIPGTQCQIKKALYVGEGVPARLCHEIGDRRRIRLLLEKEIRQGKYTKEFFDAIDKSFKGALKEIRAFTKTDFSAATNKDLVKYFEIFYQIYIKTFHPMVLAIYASDLQDLFEKELHKVLQEKERGRDKIMEYTALLLTPTRLSALQKEEQLLHEIQHDFEKRHKNKTQESFGGYISQKQTKEKLRNLCKLFGWFHMEYIGEPWTIEDYKKHLWTRIMDMEKDKAEWKDQKSPEERLAITRKLQKEFFEAHPDSSFLKELIFAMQEFLIVLDYSKADVIEGIYNARPLLSEIAKRLGAGSWVDVRYLIKNEIKHMLKNNIRISAPEISDRKANWTILLDDDEITVYGGGTAVQIADNLMEKEAYEPINEFKGLVAYLGKITGIVTVITSAQEKDKFEHGRILVTHDTSPELTSVIKKSAAIVADLGGFLSHTAIVAREFKIPCIVSTKIATKVLKDGDLVEVDAINGIVRRLDSIN